MLDWEVVERVLDNRSLERDVDHILRAGNQGAAIRVHLVFAVYVHCHYWQAEFKGDVEFLPNESKKESAYVGRWFRMNWS
jgi:hypothetical protein